ncbi:hypothetical protein GY45DRAFT_305864 [Cubamyces sp. BRFM 1775]|nr:hypothetical protein GY45DRAFT_305864 [Cubamyces sp. BRFM 1775]
MSGIGDAVLAVPKAIGKGYLAVISGILAGASKINRNFGIFCGYLCCPCTCGTSLIVAADE